MLTAFKNLRIRHKILIMSMLVILVSSVSTLASYAYLSQALKIKTLNQGADIMNAMIGEMDRFFNELDLQAFTTCSNADLQRYIMQNSSLTQYERQRLYDTVSQVMAQISIPRDYVKVHLFSDYLPRPMIAQQQIRWLNEAYDYKSDDWYRQLSALEDSNRIIMANGSQHYYEPLARDQVTTCAYRILSRTSLSVIGYLLIDIDKSYFDNFFIKNPSSRMTIHLLTEGKEAIYASAGPDGPHLAEALHAAAPGLDRSASGQMLSRLSGQEFLTVYGQSTVTGWHYISLQPSRDLLNEIRIISLLFSAWFLATLAVAAVLSMALARQITTPLEKLISEMKEAKPGHLPLPVPVDTHDESGELVRQYNDTIGEINELLRRNQSMALLKKEAELNALQQQINPHFIYNTLEIMIGMACENDSDGIIQVCKSLGRMLSYNLDLNSTVSLRDEMKHVANYLSIIESRWHGRFETKYQLDPRTLDLQHLKFIIQPLVENAIIHGFADLVSGGLLTLSSRLAGDKLQIEICDNGCGMDEAKRQSLLQVSADLKPEGEQSIGLSNVFHRLKLHFSDQASFDIHSSPGGGTCIYLEVPAIPLPDA